MHQASSTIVIEPLSGSSVISLIWPMREAFRFRDSQRFSRGAVDGLAEFLLDVDQFRFQMAGGLLLELQLASVFGVGDFFLSCSASVKRTVYAICRLIGEFSFVECPFRQSYSVPKVSQPRPLNLRFDVRSRFLSRRNLLQPGRRRTSSGLRQLAARAGWPARRVHSPSNSSVRT